MLLHNTTLVWHHCSVKMELTCYTYIPELYCAVVQVTLAGASQEPLLPPCPIVAACMPYKVAY